MNGLFDAGQRISLAICTPWPMRQVNGRMVHECMSPLWYRARAAVHLPTNYNSVEVFADGMPVDEARNMAVRAVLDMEERPAFLFWIDYDVIVPADCLAKLFFRAKCYPEIDVFAGVYCLKNSSVPDPLIYTENGAGAFWDWSVGDLLTTDTHGVNAVHSGLTLIRTSLFQRMLDESLVGGDGTDLTNEPFYHTVFETNTNKDGHRLLKMSTEDIYFHAKARQAGAKILVDTSVLAGHLDKNTGVIYGLPWGHGPTKGARWLKKPGADVSEDQEEATKLGLKLALDLGAADEKRRWDGHVTYTTDIRPGEGIDYVMDSRMLNLPDGHFDLVASSHHLEHIPRWDQEQVWKEMARVLRPGGAVEHIVPSLDWAAAKLREEQIDWHVFNVLYGSQEATCEWGREHNLHRFGYTKKIAEGLCELAGLVDVEVRDWRDDESLGLNMVIRAKKPVLVEVLAS